MALNVLIVDDSETIREMVRRTLDLSGIPVKEVFEAENGQVALEKIDQEWIDIVLCDINMPTMNGVELVERMAEEKLLSSSPVVIVSTEGSESRIDYLKSLGISGFIRKPFPPEKLRDVVFQATGVNAND
jgi:two-component system chemotaxis response regulator CheY